MGEEGEGAVTAKPFVAARQAHCYYDDSWRDIPVKFPLQFLLA